MEDIQNEYTKSYDKGFFNRMVRYWFYLQRGLQVLNEFKYLGAGIFAFYYTLDLHSIPLLIGIFIVSIPVLVVTGFVHVHKMAKALEWISMMFSSYFARHTVDLQEKQVLHTYTSAQRLDEILAELKEMRAKR